MKKRKAAKAATSKKTPAPLLVVDLGNSETVIGWYADGALASHWRIGSRPRTADEVALLLRSLSGGDGSVFRGQASVLCSVVPPATRDFAAALAQLTGRDPLIVDHRTAGIPVRYKDPAAVGPDRIANAVAARALYGAPAIVVDLGTATTFDVVGARGDYLGGAIAPGVITASEELFRRAARLARVELEIPARAIGRTPAESLQAGILLGTAGLVDTLVRRITRELGAKPRVIATGGLSGVIAPACETIQVVDEWLTLHGLCLIHERKRASRHRRET
jgi:type III pantothenate kinase